MARKQFSVFAAFALALVALLTCEIIPVASAADNIEDAVLASLGMSDNIAVRDGLRSVRETFTGAIDYAKNQLAAAGIGSAGSSDNSAVKAKEKVVSKVEQLEEIAADATGKDDDLSSPKGDL